MKTRRLLFSLVAAVSLTAVLAVPALAQEGDSPVPTTSPSIPTTTTSTSTTVLGTSTSVAPTSTEAPTTTEETTTTVAVISEGTTPPPTVQGAVVTRPLPRTGGSIGSTALFGLALTGAGIVLAVGARRKRTTVGGEA